MPTGLSAVTSGERQQNHIRLHERITLIRNRINMLEDQIDDLITKISGTDERNSIAKKNGSENLSNPNLIQVLQLNSFDDELESLDIIRDKINQIKEMLF